MVLILVHVMKLESWYGKISCLVVEWYATLSKEADGSTPRMRRSMRVSKRRLSMWSSDYEIILPW
jgi:hypothetical protein